MGPRAVVSMDSRRRGPVQLRDELRPLVKAERTKPHIPGRDPIGVKRARAHPRPAVDLGGPKWAVRWRADAVSEARCWCSVQSVATRAAAIKGRITTHA